MTREYAQSLATEAQNVAKVFSNPQREYNQSQETFEVEKVVPLSENTAVVYYKKSSGKLALGFFYHIRASGGRWNYFFPSDSHILGFESFREHYEQVEKHNYNFNFDVIE